MTSMIKPGGVRRAVPLPVRAAAQAARVNWRRQRLQLSSYISVRTLARRNRTSTQTVTGEAPVCVSLTTYGKRLQSVYLTIESIAAGGLRPARLILWLDDPAAAAALPEELERLVGRGLEIKLTENLGPHTKYYPYVSGEDDGGLALVTADDDILYPSNWLAGLVDGHRRHPGDVICYRAWVVRIDNGAVAPYDSWDPCRSTEPSVRNFATGVSGVLYPPPMIGEIAAAGTAFLESCPAADDIWLHAMALRSGRRIRQVKAHPQHFPLIPDTQDMGLSQSNFVGRRNDLQAAATYGPEDIELMDEYSN
jgi:hypothetical protein